MVEKMTPVRWRTSSSTSSRVGGHGMNLPTATTTAQPRTAPRERELSATVYRAASGATRTSAPKSAGSVSAKVRKGQRWRKTRASAATSDTTSPFSSRTART
jgi:hypothetical protein